MAVTPDLAVDFMDMTNDRHLITRVVEARQGFEPVVGAYAVGVTTALMRRSPGSRPSTSAASSSSRFYPGRSRPTVTGSHRPEHRSD